MQIETSTQESSSIKDLEYIRDRLDPAQKYFSRNARFNKILYYFFKTVTLAIAVSIPYLTGLIKENEQIVKIIIGALSLVLAFCNGLDTLWKFHEKWISYRVSSEELKQEKFLYQSKAGPYSNSNSWPLLTERVEMVLSKQNGAWSQYMQDNKSTKEPS